MHRQSCLVSTAAAPRSRGSCSACTSARSSAAAASGSESPAIVVSTVLLHQECTRSYLLLLVEPVCLLDVKVLPEPADLLSQGLVLLLDLGKAALQLLHRLGQGVGRGARKG